MCSQLIRKRDAAAAGAQKEIDRMQDEDARRRVEQVSSGADADGVCCGVTCSYEPWLMVG